MIRALLGLTTTPNDDAADAIAIVLKHLRADETAQRGLPASMPI